MEFLDYLEWIIDALQAIAESIDNVASFGQNMADSTASIKDTITSICNLFVSFFLFGGTILILTITIASILILIGIYVFGVIPIFVLAKKTNRRTALWAWIPFLNKFTLCDIPGDKPFELFGKWHPFENRLMIYLVLALVEFFIPPIIWFVGSFLAASVLIGIWYIVYLVCFVASFAISTIFAWCKYIVLRDVLDCFSNETKRNRTMALLATIVDTYILHISLSQTLLLYSIIRKKPLPTEEPIVERVVGEPVLEEFHGI